MKIKSVNIKNFRSVKDVVIPFQSYGSGSNISSATFLVGLNESGKSAILDALSLISEGMDSINYEESCFLETQEKKYNYIDLYIDLELGHIDFWRDQVAKKFSLTKNLIDKLKFESVVLNTYRDLEASSFLFKIVVNEDLPFYEHVVTTKTSTDANGKQAKIRTIGILKEVNKIEENITESNASSFLLENQELLTRDELQGQIGGGNLKQF